MYGNKMTRIAVWAAGVLAAGTVPYPVHAQLVRSDSQTQTAAPATVAPAAQAPSGKRRLSQEVQVTGEQLWTDTGITVQPGEHVVATATGKVHYSDSQDDAGPAGLARGFKDLIRILPYNNAGRGAVIGRVGDAASAQPFLIGAHCDIVSFSGGAGRVDHSRFRMSIAAYNGPRPLSSAAAGRFATGARTASIEPLY